MTRGEKLLYHQVHPVKLLVDVATSFASSWLLWDARWTLAALVAFIPSIVVTAVLVLFVELEPYRRTVIGRYVAAHMTRKIEIYRLSGQAVMWAGAIMHVTWLLPFGFVIVLLAWLSGLWAESL